MTIAILRKYLVLNRLLIVVNQAEEHRQRAFDVWPRVGVLLARIRRQRQRAMDGGGERFP